MTAAALRAVSQTAEVNLMSAFAQLDQHWMNPVACVVIALGLMLVWRGLRGGRDGERALLGQRIDTLNRIESFRLTVFGSVLVGIGAAVIWWAQWLLLLALGIGFVEILESSALIAVWKWDRRQGATWSGCAIGIQETPQRRRA